MKLQFNIQGKSQPDPFIFRDGDTFYIYVTANAGVECYKTEDIFGEWQFVGVVTDFADGNNFWAPSVIKYQDMYYMYVSCARENAFQFLHVAKAASPEGPFTEEKCLFDHFSIDSHVVETEAGLFLWYAENNEAVEKKGTRVFVDKLIDPYTPAYQPKEVILPDFPEELFTPQCHGDDLWYTVEGPFWLKEGEWQYVMYSAGCYQDDTYHIGYARAKSDEADLTKVEFEKYTEKGAFAPVLIKNDFEEGTGHHSVLKLDDTYYAIYHGRDWGDLKDGYHEARTARICKLHINDGIITVERYPDKI